MQLTISQMTTGEDCKTSAVARTERFFAAFRTTLRSARAACPPFGKGERRGGKQGREEGTEWEEIVY